MRITVLEGRTAAPVFYAEVGYDGRKALAEVSKALKPARVDGLVIRVLKPRTVPPQSWPYPGTFPSSSDSPGVVLFRRLPRILA